MGDDRNATSPHARIQSQLRLAHTRACAITRKLDDLGSRLRHLDRIESSIEQADRRGAQDASVLAMPPPARRMGEAALDLRASPKRDEAG